MIDGPKYMPITTQVDEHEERLDELEKAIHDLAVRITRIDKMFAQITTAAIAATAAFDSLRELMVEQTGLEGATVYDQDAELEDTQMIVVEETKERYNSPIRNMGPHKCEGEREYCSLCGKDRYDNDHHMGVSVEGDENNDQPRPTF